MKVDAGGKPRRERHGSAQAADERPNWERMRIEESRLRRVDWLSRGAAEPTHVDVGSFAANTTPTYNRISRTAAGPRVAVNRINRELFWVISIAFYADVVSMGRPAARFRTVVVGVRGRRGAVRRPRRRRRLPRPRRSPRSAAARKPEPRSQETRRPGSGERGGPRRCAA